MPFEEPKPDRRAAQKLDALDHLPEGFRFRQTAVWEKLEAGLQPVSKKPTFRWWYAAAILAGIGAGIPFFFSQKKQPEPATIAARTNNQLVSPASTTARVTTTTVKASATKPALKRKTQPTRSLTAPTALPDKVTLEETKTEVAVTQLPVLTEPTTVTVEPVAVTTPRSRFRIIHSNELRLPQIPADVLNNASKNAYSSLSRHIKGPTASEEEPVAEPYQPTKKPKTLIGIFNTHQ